MRYVLKIQEEDVLGLDWNAGNRGEAGSTAFVRQVTGAPPAVLWRQGRRVADAKLGDIQRGTAIATFVDGRYPADARGRHAAIYLAHDAQKILVLDQANQAGTVKPRAIWFRRASGTLRGDDAGTFHVIE